MTRLASLIRTGTRRGSGSPSSTGTPSPSGSSRWPDLDTGAAIRDGQAAGMSGALEAYGGPTEGCVCVTKVCACGTLEVMDDADAFLRMYERDSERILLSWRGGRWMRRSRWS
jgi:hypothetical protein